jgi:NADPH-dependent curcumin reductase CurA
LDNFSLVSSPTPDVAEGEVLVRHHYLSLDPYMRGRMNDAKSYAQPQALNQTMLGGTVGEVIESRFGLYTVVDAPRAGLAAQAFCRRTLEAPGAF